MYIAAPAGDAPPDYLSPAEIRGGTAIASAVVSLLPVIGQIKGAIEAISGQDLITGEELSASERLLNAVGALGGAVGGAMKLARVADVGVDTVQVVRASDDVVRIINEMSVAKEITGATRFIREGSAMHDLHDVVQALEKIETIAAVAKQTDNAVDGVQLALALEELVEATADLPGGVNDVADDFGAAPFDSSGDGVADSSELVDDPSAAMEDVPSDHGGGITVDSSGDGFADATEVDYPDGPAEGEAGSASVDSSGDGWLDTSEITESAASTAPFDSSGDGVADTSEVIEGTSGSVGVEEVYDEPGSVQVDASGDGFADTTELVDDGTQPIDSSGDGIADTTALTDPPSVPIGAAPFDSSGDGVADMSRETDIASVAMDEGANFDEPGGLPADSSGDGWADSTADIDEPAEYDYSQDMSFEQEGDASAADEPQSSEDPYSQEMSFEEVSFEQPSPDEPGAGTSTNDDGSGDLSSGADDDGGAS